MRTFWKCFWVFSWQAISLERNQMAQPQPQAPTPGDRKFPFCAGRQTRVSVLSVRSLPTSGSQVMAFHPCGPGIPHLPNGPLWAQPSHMLQEQVDTETLDEETKNVDYIRGWVLCSLGHRQGALGRGDSPGVGSEGRVWRRSDSTQWRVPSDVSSPEPESDRRVIPASPTLNWTRATRETLSPVLRPKPPQWGGLCRIINLVVDRLASLGKSTGRNFSQALKPIISRLFLGICLFPLQIL